MSQVFQYPCPKCGTTNILHELGCKYEHDHPYETFEKYYTDIIVVLSGFGAVAAANDTPDAAMPYDTLREQVEDLPPAKNPWIPKHQECLQQLKNERRVEDGPNGLRLLKPGERVEQIIPTFDPLQTIYECGPVDGCKDYAVYTMLSWCSLKGLSWQQTQNFCQEWFEKTGAWTRESWGESSVQALLESKRHVHRGDLGWGDYAEQSKQIIEESDVSPQFDATEMYGLQADDYE